MARIIGTNLTEYLNDEVENIKMLIVKHEGKHTKPNIEYSELLGFLSLIYSTVNSFQIDSEDYYKLLDKQKKTSDAFKRIYSSIKDEDRKKIIKNLKKRADNLIDVIEGIKVK